MLEGLTALIGMDEVSVSGAALRAMIGEDGGIMGSSAAGLRIKLEEDFMGV